MLFGETSDVLVGFMVYCYALRISTYECCYVMLFGETTEVLDGFMLYRYAVTACCEDYKLISTYECCDVMLFGETSEVLVGLDFEGRRAGLAEQQKTSHMYFSKKCDMYL